MVSVAGVPSPCLVAYSRREGQDASGQEVGASLGWFVV